jgi:2',3'-cyclic-nucleotide 2'-phosphodiesterase (5'-nucleotidase family)
MVVGDFNRHDQFWGGDGIAIGRQGEADKIIEFMVGHSLVSSLPRGTKTWSEGDRESTVDLVLTSSGLEDCLVRCGLYDVEHGIRVLAFGFLFDFTGNDNNSFVQPVKDTIKEQWFQDAIHDSEVDIFVVTGHVGLKQREFINIYEAIRAAQWDTPIMLFGGHTHIRDYVKYDGKAYGLESGRYMETIGFQSVSGLPSHTEKKGKIELRSATTTFARRYIDNNLFSLQSHTGLNSSTFPTEHGKNVSIQIDQARKELKLDETFGCAPRDLWMARAPYPHEDSIFSWLDSTVMPEKVIDEKRKDKPRIVLANTGAMRFDIFRGPFTKDTTFIVSPFTSGFRYIPNVPFSQADRLLQVLNHAGNILAQAQSNLSDWQLVPPEQIGRTTNIVASTAKRTPQVQNQQTLSSTAESPLIPGYTTYDDAGSDGDDTVHSEISFYLVPNCIESRINMNKQDDTDPNDAVDVIFLEFIQPWVLAALRFLGAEYTANDTAAYIEGKSFTSMIAEWVSENWKDNC